MSNACLIIAFPAPLGGSRTPQPPSPRVRRTQLRRTTLFLLPSADVSQVLTYFYELFYSYYETNPKLDPVYLYLGLRVQSCRFDLDRE